MNNTLKIALIALGILLVGAAGYGLGSHNQRGDAGVSGAAKAERKLLYYRNPMGLADTSAVPKKDAMGMDYVAVYEGEAAASDEPDGFSISVAKVQKLGVQSEAASWRELHKTLRVTGRIEIDERRSYTIAPKFEGWVDKLYVNSTGQSVAKGQALFDVYSPELVSAQREHRLAIQGLAAMQDADEDAQKSMQRLAAASATRLKNWDVADALATGAKRGEPANPASISDAARVTFRAPVSGIVLEKKAIQGMRFMPGEVLYQIADLAVVWVIADVPEQDIAHIRLGQAVQLGVAAYPAQNFAGKVGFIYPTLNSATRTVQVRIEIANAQGLLKPAMFANAEIALGSQHKVLSVPSSAIIDSGTKQVVLVRLAQGRFAPRIVSLGSRSDDYVEVLSGVAEGEQVVTAANFLLDAESNLKAALSGMSSAALPAVVAPGSSQAASPQVKTVAVQSKQPPHSVGHLAQGVLDAINADGTVSISHEAIASLGWPAMTMDFALANAALVQAVPVASRITFELVERKPDDWVITKLQVQHEGH